MGIAAVRWAHLAMTDSRRRCVVRDAVQCTAPHYDACFATSRTTVILRSPQGGRLEGRTKSAIGVGVGVLLVGVFRVLQRVQMVAVRQMRVMAGLLVVRGAVQFRGPAVMLCGGLVVLGGLFVMLGQKAGVHDLSSFTAGNAPGARIGQ
jgi:hypothetical protein